MNTNRKKQAIDTELIMLGTGNAMVTKCYNTCFIIRNSQEYFLVDAGGGNGILAQMEKAAVSYSGIHHMFVTHGHTDHVLGAIWIIRKIATLMGKEEYEGNFTIYCHDQVLKMIRIICDLTLAQKFLKYIGNRIILQEVKNGEEINAIGIKFLFFDIASTKLKQFGFTAILPDNKQLVCLGDEPCHEKNRTYVKDCDWLLSEAFCLYRDKDIFGPYEKHHSTVLDAASMAEELEVKNLVLYHTEDKNLSDRKCLYTQEAETVFSGSVYVPDDLDRIKL